MSRLISILLTFPLVAAATDDAESWGARLQLISENSVVAAGEPFEVGVRIHHREGFHSYWVNPGVVGFATKVEWKLPQGFSAGPLVWPPPELVDMAGNITHGYERDVLLTATITPPAALRAKEVTLEARIAWMACSNACHPGDELFSLTLPVGLEAATDPKTAPLFEQTRNNQPAPLNGWSAKLLSEVDAPEIVLQLSRVDEQALLLDSPYFFSSDGQVAEGTPSVTSEEDGTMIYTFQRAEFGPKGARGLPGLIAYGLEDDRQFGTIDP